MSELDWVLAVIILISTIVGVSRGMVREIFALIGWIAAFFVSLYYAFRYRWTHAENVFSSGAYCHCLRFCSRVGRKAFETFIILNFDWGRGQTFGMFVRFFKRNLNCWTFGLFRRFNRIRFETNMVERFEFGSLCGERNCSFFPLYPD